MTDYSKLSKELWETDSSDWKRLSLDAAAAIEALQSEVERLKAENPIVETVLVDKMRQQMEETVCHCNVKENAELIAKILDDDVDRKVFELPKRGEWIHGREIGKEWMYDHWITYYEDWHCSNCKVVVEQEEKPKYNFCPNCGADMRKIEAQE